MVKLPRRLLAAAGDSRLVEQLRRGNEAAFEVIYDRYHRRLLGYCRHLTGSVSEAEDALQQTFASAYRALRDGGDRIDLRPWLYSIARNTCLSELRRRRARAEDPAAEVLHVDHADSSGVAAERRAEVRQLIVDLAALPEDQRSAIVLSEIGDLPHDEIAGVIGCERMKVKSLVHQARQRLFERRRAREASCEEVREALSTLRGGSLRRAWIQLHLRSCPGCRVYRTEVRRQRALLGLTVPVPSLGLRRSVLTATSGGGGGGGAALAGGAASGGAAAAGGGVAAGGGFLSGVASAVGTKAVVGLVLAGGAAAGGMAAQGGPYRSGDTRPVAAVDANPSETGADGETAQEPIGAAPEDAPATTAATTTEQSATESTYATTEAEEPEEEDDARPEDREGRAEPAGSEEEHSTAEPDEGASAGEGREKRRERKGTEVRGREPRSSAQAAEARGETLTRDLEDDVNRVTDRRAVGAGDVDRAEKAVNAPR